MFATTILRVGTISVVLAVSNRPVTYPAPIRQSESRSMNATTAGACSVAVVSKRRIVLADGQILHIAVGSTARQDGAVLLTGTPTFTWAAGAAPGASPQTRDSLIGVLVTEAGEFRGVPNPIPGRTVEYPKVAPAGGGAWHVVLLERLTTRDGHDQESDSAQLWYGRYDGRRWTGVAPVTRIHGSYMAGEYTSDLMVSTDGNLAFAYALDAEIGAQPVVGVVLLRRERQRWVSDTLGRLIEPRYVRLLPSKAAGSWSVLFVAPFFEDGRFINASLLAAEWSGRWSRPAVIVRASDRSIINPRSFVLGRGVLVTWTRQAGRRDADGAPRVEWAITPTTQPPSELVAATAILGTNEYTAITLGTDSITWFARDGLAADKVRVALFGTDSLTDLGTLRIRNEVRLAAVGLSDARVALVTSELGTQSTEPPAASVLTVITPVCRGG